MADVVEVADRYIKAKLAANAAKEELDVVHAELLDVMAQLQLKTITSDEHNCTMTVANGTRRSFIPDVLKAVLPARIWKAVRIDAVDTKKLEGYLQAGEVTEESLGEGMVTTIVAPYIRFTQGKPAAKKS